jgi:nitric oxide reductase subunit C
MLSKSQARLFFILGTVLFSLVFLFLTVDTVRKVPAQTKQQNITEAVHRGKKIWEKNNCMGCHTLLGEGAYYAPELTKSYEKRGEVWLKTFLKNPQAMYPNDRKMVQYNFSDEEINDVIAFLKWINEMDLNGFPAKPSLSIPNTNASTNLHKNTAVAELKQPEKFSQLCVACHSINGQGTDIGPALDTVGRKYSTAYLKNWIKDPIAVNPNSKMPKLPLSDIEIDELANYLSNFK